MSEITLARPWWVNLSIVIPFVTYCFLRKKRLSLTGSQFLITALFAIAFGFIEASVVIYLRAITGVVLGSGLSEIGTFSSRFYREAQILPDFPADLLKVEVSREVATLVVLGCLASLTVSGLRERCAVFLWTFAIWDICYYLWLRIFVGWPSSLTTPDVLFLIPVPWRSQVWFPLIVSVIMMLAVMLVKRGARDYNR